MSGTLFYRYAVCIAIMACSVAADSDTRTVQAEFDRCETVMDRFERSLRRFEDAAGGIRRKIADLPPANRDAVSQEVLALENRIEYFRNRYERSRGQADKIRGELKNLKGPTCPSCIESSVNMYCRNGETLQNDIDEFLLKAADLESRVATAGGTPAADAREKMPAAGFAQRRSAIDSLRRVLPACTDAAAATLHGQAVISINRADSLYAQKNAGAALKALDIATVLLNKAAKRCNGK